MTDLERQFNETLARTRITALETLAAVLNEAAAPPREHQNAKVDRQLLNLRLRAALAILRTKPIKPGKPETSVENAPEREQTQPTSSRSARSTAAALVAAADANPPVVADSNARSTTNPTAVTTPAPARPPGRELAA